MTRLLLLGIHQRRNSRQPKKKDDNQTIKQQLIHDVVSIVADLMKTERNANATARERVSIGWE
jgi:hypothetical protein